MYCLGGIEREVRYSYSGLEILLGEGGEVELGARTSKHILLLAFDPLVSLTLSLICAKHHSYHHIIFACVEHNSYCLTLFHIAIHSYMLGLIVCVPHLYLINKSFT